MDEVQKPSINEYIVTCIPIARQWLGQTRLNVREDVFYVVLAATVAMQWCGKHACNNTGQ
jgi:hypothetical protein